MVTNPFTKVDAEKLAEMVGDMTSRELFGITNPNGTIKNSVYRTLLQLEPKGLTKRDDVITEDNSGTVRFDDTFGSPKTYELQTAFGDANSNAILETAKLVKYKSGNENQIGIRVLIQDGEVAAGKAEWGLGAPDRADSAFYRQVASGTKSCVVRRNNVETVVPESQWSVEGIRDFENENGDVDFQIYGHKPFAETNTLGNSLDTSFGYIYGIGYGWYGQLPITFFIDTFTGGGFNRPQPVVSFIPKGKTSITIPNHPIFANLDNDGTAGQTRMNVAGRQGGFFGTPEGEGELFRHKIFSPSAISDTGYTTIVAGRRKLAEVGVPINITSVEVVGGGTYDVEIRTRVSLTGNPAYGVEPNGDNEDTAPFELETAETVASSGGELTGVPVAGDTLKAGERNRVEAGAFKEDNPIRTTPFVRTEPFGVVAREVAAGAPTTPDYIVINFEVDL